MESESERWFLSTSVEESSTEQKKEVEAENKEQKEKSFCAAWKMFGFNSSSNGSIVPDIPCVDEMIEVPPDEAAPLRLSSSSSDTKASDESLYKLLPKTPQETSSSASSFAYVTVDNDPSSDEVVEKEAETENVLCKKIKSFWSFLKRIRTRKSEIVQDVQNEDWLLPRNPAPSPFSSFVIISLPLDGSRTAPKTDNLGEKGAQNSARGSLESTEDTSNNNNMEEELRKWEMRTRFSFGRQIGSGAYGSVVRVQEKKSRKLFALKIIQGTTARLYNVPSEISALKRTSGHPLFLRFFGSYSHNFHDDTKECGILTEMFKSRNLNNWRLIYCLRQVDLKFILYQLGKALAYLHSLKIIHCDVKLDNILIKDNLSIKLIDLGNCQKGPYSTARCGTLGYCAPEVLRLTTTDDNQIPYGYAVDYYATGAVIYDIFYGKPPPKTEPFLHVMDILLSYSTKSEKATEPRQHFGYIDEVTKEDVTLMAKLLNYSPEARPNDDIFLHDIYFDNLPGKLKRKLANLEEAKSS